MRTCLSVALVASGFLCLALPATAAAQDARDSVTTTGQARIEAVPDIAWLSFGVSARRPTVEAARDEVAGIVDQLIRLAKQYGLANEDIATAAVSVRPEFDWDPETRERRMLGYLVSRDIQLRLRDLARLGELTEAALGAGVTDAAPVRFDTSRRDELEQEALAAAARDALARAGVLAAALGARAGKPLRISAGGGPMPPVPMARAEDMVAAAPPSGAETYEPGRIVVTASVSAEFQLISP